MDSREIRQKFLDFFKEKKHQIVPSAPLVVKDDPTLMFTNAGMNQFKDYFLGNKTPKTTRVADTQKCLRVSGKHNDLEEVGLDTYHHTMFEMLGNWSFGDYFKKEAIEWAWELLTEVYKLPSDRLYATVFEGDKSDGLEPDNEALELWKRYLPEERILYGSKKDNFWEMGDTGPCGPCSEIHIDLRSEKEIEQRRGKDLVNADHPLVIEVWNLVFIQFNRKADSSLEPLPDKHVDTGMGFERLVMAIQNKTSNYDTDVFQPMIHHLEKISGKKYGQKEQIDIAFRVIADHVRAVSFAVADDQMPSNTGAGYVIRRILRRAIRYGFTYLDFKEPFIYQLVNVLADQLGFFFPEIKDQKEFVAKVIREEEQSFLRTLENGIRIFEEESNRSKKEISGEIAFKLYDTYGFPIDLTVLLAREKDLTVNMEEFQALLKEQKDRSRSAGEQEKGDWTIVHSGNVEFVGYENLTSQSKILRYRTIKEKKKESYQVVLEKTPFYAESGGQVGDTGFITDEHEKILVTDTQKENELIVHYVNKLPSNPDALYQCIVDEHKRKLTENNHSCTHLMHAALRKVLGDHVQQRGSLVNDKILRFDFSHFAKMTDEEIRGVERIVNEKIREDIHLDEKRNIPIDEAKKMGAMALFGEKYGDFVRVITFDKNYSVELCGGTHVPTTGKIGLFKIISESSVAAGVRRIEACTAEGAENYINENLEILEQIKGLLKSPSDPIKLVQNLIEEKNQLSKELEKIQLDQASRIKADLKEKIMQSNDVNLIVEKVTLPSADSLKKLSFELKNEVQNILLVLAADIKGNPMISVVVSENLIKSHDLNAGNLVKEFAREINGGGGGQPFFATAGGKKLEGLDNVIQIAKEKFSAEFSIN